LAEYLLSMRIAVQNVGRDGWRTRYGDSLRDRRSENRIPVKAILFALVQTDPGVPASVLYIVYRVLLGGRAASAWTLNTHFHLESRLKKE
jgi:hypothetical protein